MLGCGAFGMVELCEHTRTGDTYALKAMSKGFIVQARMKDNVMNERNVGLALNSPFVVRLYEAYASTQTLSFLLEAALGGELYTVYHQKSLYGSEEHAKFYSASVVFALEHCHERRIAHRDLKPENLILTHDGNLKLTDMGLAKFIVAKTYTCCGTPDYFAPEVLQCVGHNHAVDWWALGCLIYEFLTGKTPFESTDVQKIFDKIAAGVDAMSFPSVIRPEARAVIIGLMKRDPSERWPMKSGGTQNLKEASWLNTFDWVAASNQAMTAPYVPAVKSRRDLGNFQGDYERPQHVEYEDDGTGWDKDFATSS
jgi:serine/threonine protein kinase